MFTALSPASTDEGRDSPRAMWAVMDAESVSAPVGINVVNAGVLPTVYLSLMEKNVGGVTVEMAPLSRTEQP